VPAAIILSEVATESKLLLAVVTASIPGAVTRKNSFKSNDGCFQSEILHDEA
jgi:hypothetical protein